MAQRLADEWEQLEKVAGKGRLTESHSRKVIAQMYERTVGEPLHFRTAREHLDERVQSNGFLSAMANAGVTQELRQKLTGHASAQMNAQYTHHELEALRAAIAVIPSIAGK